MRLIYRRDENHPKTLFFSFFNSLSQSVQSSFYFVRISIYIWMGTYYFWKLKHLIFMMNRLMCRPFNNGNSTRECMHQCFYFKCNCHWHTKFQPNESQSYTIWLWFELLWKLFGSKMKKIPSMEIQPHTTWLMFYFLPFDNQLQFGSIRSAMIRYKSIANKC